MTARWPRCETRGRTIRCRAVVSNANLRTTILKMIGSEMLDRDYRREDAKRFD